MLGRLYPLLACRDVAVGGAWEKVQLWWEGGGGRDEHEGKWGLD
jgi:hypothetical protein